MSLISIGECPVCRQGELIVVKDPAREMLLVICDDCESQWDSPENAVKGGPLHLAGVMSCTPCSNRSKTLEAS